MDADLAQLVPIALLDDQLADLHERIGRAQRKLAKAEEEVARLTAAIAGHDEAITALKRTERAQQTELERVDGLRRSAQDALDNGYGSADAAQRQIDRCAELADAAETAILEAMEAREARQAARTQAEADRVQAQEALATAHATLDPTIEGWRTEVRVLSTERSPLVAALARDIGGTYAQMHARKGSALAVCQDGVCTACSRVVPLRRTTDIKQGRLVTCDGCGRWLYAPPEPATSEA